MKKILVVGAGVAGKDVVREIKNEPKIGLKVIGFIDDDPTKAGKIIYGVKVLGKGEEIKKIISKFNVDEVIIAIPSARGEDIKKYVRLCSEAKVGFKIVPRVKEIIEGKAKLESLRKVKVEDLLGRPVVKSDIKGLKEFFRGKRVLITGAAGSIGSELSRQIAAYKPVGLILLDWWENGIFDLQSELTKDFPELNIDYVIASIRDREKVDNIFSSFKPHFVFHAAAYKHVPLMEEFPEEAVKNNILGTLSVAESAKSFGVERFVLVSTDKAANPVNVMGATKLVTEGIGKMLNSQKTKFTSHDGTKFIAVRFGNVLDSYGSVIPIFRKQIEEGGPVTITDRKMTRYFMTIPEAAQLILKAASIGCGGELFVLDMGQPVKIVDLAESMIRLSGFIPGKDIAIEFIGKRPGEKISEEIFSEKEKLSATKEGKIFISKSSGFDIRKLPIFLRKVEKLANNNNRNGIREELKRMGVLG